MRVNDKRMWRIVISVIVIVLFCVSVYLFIGTHYHLFGPRGLNGALRERPASVTFRDKSLTLIGEKVMLGQEAPLFTVLDENFDEVGLINFRDKIKLIASVPSLDTPVCSEEIKRFNQEAAGLSDKIALIFISMDLPFAQERFCDAMKIERVKTFSDYRDANFGIHYGVLIKELRLLSRAIFVLDKYDVVQYVEYVEDSGKHPDYEATLRVLRRLAEDEEVSPF